MLRPTQFLLPSGLISISVATVKQRTVAIDAQGSAFLNGEEGKGWRPIAPLWRGKAVRVETNAQGALLFHSASTTPGPSEYASNPQLNKDAPHAEGPPEKAMERRKAAEEQLSKEEAGKDRVMNASKSSTDLALPANAISGNTASPLMPTGLFRLVTDRGEKWVSADGKTWHIEN